MTSLLDKHCQPDARLLLNDEVLALLAAVPAWEASDDGKSISQDFKFSNYGETMAFVNKVAAVAEQQNHHPDMLVTYNHCIVTFTTHSAGGLTKNDFICAANIDVLGP